MMPNTRFNAAHLHTLEIGPCHTQWTYTPPYTIGVEKKKGSQEKEEAGQYRSCLDSS
jgi:hypothetical protein